jgi:hypothetical protein
MGMGWLRVALGLVSFGLGPLADGLKGLPELASALDIPKTRKVPDLDPQIAVQIICRYTY